MKFLLMPENNSLSHITKCLSIMDALQLYGHEVQLAIGKRHSDFLRNLGIEHHILSDIQETDSGGFPTFKWFSNIDIIANCIKEEVALINKVKPDKVIGIFRSTLYASSQIAQVPYDSLICGCMVPESHEALGFSQNETGYELQKKFLTNFFGFAGIKMSRAMAKFGLAKIDDIRMAFKGEHTFLWDFPEFMSLQTTSEMIHIGPISLNHWPYDSFNLEDILDPKHPIAIVSFGTCVTDNTIVLRIVRLLLESGYKVIVAAGGQKEMFNIEPSDSRVIVLKYAPLTAIFPHASLLVTHGGQMTVFEALQNQVPVLVMPFQPEQAHNGVCLERIGCGNRLIPSTLFSGLSEDYIKAFARITDDEIRTKINNLVGNSNIKKHLNQIKQALDHYRGVETLVKFLEVK